jgi:hypothetical protein
MRPRSAARTENAFLRSALIEFRKNRKQMRSRAFYLLLVKNRTLSIHRIACADDFSSARIGSATPPKRST